MKINLNGISIEVSSPITLDELIEKKITTPGNYACAVNSYFIPKSKYKNHQIQPNDHIEIVMAMQGG